MRVDTSEEGVEVTPHDHVLSGSRVDWFGHVQDLGFPVIFPPRLGPEQTLISDPEHHQ